MFGVLGELRTGIVIGEEMAGVLMEGVCTIGDGLIKSIGELIVEVRTGVIRLIGVAMNVDIEIVEVDFGVAVAIGV